MPESEERNYIKSNQNISNIFYSSEPNNPTNISIFAKILIWVVVGFLIAILISIIITMLGTKKFATESGGFLPFIMLIIAFICSFIWNLIVVWAYSLFFGDIYKNFSKSFSFILVSNAIVFVLFIFIYMMWNMMDWSMFMILAFHIVLTVFISSTIMEFLTNPQYSGSFFIGNITWFILVFIIYLLIFNYFKSSTKTWTYYLMIFPPVLAYSIIPLVSSLWQKIYYSFYEMWNNFFYMPTLAEQLESEIENDTNKDEVNVDM